MPPVIIAANLIAASAISAATTIAAITGLTVAQVGLLAATAAYGIYQKRRMAKKALSDYNKSLTDRLTMVATTDAARSIILGRARNTDGVLFKGAWGPKREANFTIVVALAGHEVDAIETVYFADQAVDIDGSGYVTTAPFGSTRKVTESQEATSTGGAQTVTLPVVPTKVVSVTHYSTSGSAFVPFTWTAGSTNVSFNSSGLTGELVVTYQYNRSESYARVYKYTGAPGQNLSAMLASRFGSLITSEHRFEGIACLVVDMRWNDSAFPSGIPAVSAVVRGAKLYDPRTGVTAWSQNPALCARYLALHPWGGAAEADEIDDNAVIAAANACDVSHTYTDSNGVSTTRPIYTCSYVASTEVSNDTHMNELINAMSGEWGWAGGRIRVRAGVYTAPVAHITDDWLGPGQRQINPGPGQADLVNIMVPTIADSAQDRVSTPIAPVRAEAYITADGQELPTDVTLQAVEFAPQAQHVCAIRLRAMRQGMTLQWPVNMRGFVLELFDVITLTSSRYGFTTKPFEVMGWSFNLQGGIQLTLKETGASIYQPDDVFPANDPEPNTSLPKPWLVGAIENLQAFSGNDELLLQSDGTVVSRVRLTYDAIEDEAITGGGKIEVQYSGPDGIWQTQEFDGSSEEVFLQGLQDGSAYVIRARARSSLAAGDWSDTIAHTVIGKTGRPSDVTGLTATKVTGGVRYRWNRSSDQDRRATELRIGALWSSAAPLAQVPEPDAEFIMPWPADGTYVVLAKRVDTTGNESLTAAAVSVTVAGQEIAIDSDQILDHAATDVQYATVDNDEKIIPSTASYSYQYGYQEYTNSFSFDVEIEVSLSSFHSIETPSGAIGVYADSLLAVTKIPASGPPETVTPEVEYSVIGPITGARVEQWRSAELCNLTLAPGDSVVFRLVVYCNQTVPTTGITVTTNRGVLRMAAVKK